MSTSDDFAGAADSGEVPRRLAHLVSDFGPIHPDAESHMVAMRDGVRLATDVYLPRPLTGRVPAVLLRTCYDKCGPLMHLPAIATTLAAAGYAAVVQDVRGRFRSEGERVPFFAEVADGYDTLDWLAGQAWSDGTVGMLGTSYLGFAQWAAAASEHPALRALSLAVTSQIVPVTWWGPRIAAPAGTEWLVDEWSGPARLEGSALDWTQRPFAEVVPADLGNARRLLTLMRELARDPAQLQARAFPNGLPAARLRLPALHAGGWWDPINAWALRDWAITTTHAPAASAQRLLMAATNHVGVGFGDGDEHEDPPPVEVGLEPSLRFFDHHLRGRAEPDGPPVRFEVAGGGWRTADAWPPPGLRPWTLHLVDAGQATGSLVGGGLSDRPDTTPTVARWIHDPSAPVPSLGMDPIRPIPHEAAIHLRPDVATFTSEPLRRSVDLVGPVVALLEIDSDAPSTHVIATLVTLAPDGVVHQLVEGIAVVDTLHGPAPAVVELGTIAIRLRRGHRLRLAVASSRFPTYLPHPGTSEDLWTAVRTRATAQRLIAGGAFGSRLQLGTLPARRG